MTKGKEKMVKRKRKENKELNKEFVTGPSAEEMKKGSKICLKSAHN